MQCLSFFTENNLISPKKSGFKPGDSCINQLISSTYEIYEALDAGLEVRPLIKCGMKEFFSRYLKIKYQEIY